MRMRVALFVAVLSACVVHSLAAQAKPNFSGRWVQIAPASPDDGGGTEQVVTQDAKTLTAEHPSEGGQHRQVYKLDGESQFATGPVTSVSKTTWDGPKLVISTTSTYPGDRKRESKQVWSLGADGMLTIEASSKNPDGTTTEIKIVHRKK